MSKNADDLSCGFCYSDTMKNREEPCGEICGAFPCPDGGENVGRKNNRKEEHIPRVKTERLFQPRRMEIWYARLPLNRKTSVQGGARPVIIVSNDISIERSGTVTVVPLTTQLKHLEMPTHVVIEGVMEETSMALAEQVMTIDKKALIRMVTECKGYEDEIEAALLEQIGVAR